MAALVTMPGATGQTTSSEDASAAGLTMVHPASDDGHKDLLPHPRQKRKRNHPFS